MPVKDTKNQAMETSNTVIAKKEYSAAEKQALVSDWKQSGKTMMAFSRTIGVNYHTFINWIKPKKKNKRAKAAKAKLVACFSEIAMPALSNGNLCARVAFGKTQLDLYQPVSAGFLKELLSV